MTVLTGVNGGGKSTAIQSLLLARLATLSSGTVRLNGPLGLALGEARDVLNWTADTREITVRLGGPAGESWVFGFGLPDTEQALHLEVRRSPVAVVPGIGPGVVDPAVTYLCAERLGPRDTLSVSADEPDRIGVGVRGEFTAQVLALRESRAVGARTKVRVPLRHPEATGPQLRVHAEAWASEIIRPLRITAREVLSWLVKLLGALNDHFTRTLTDCGGDQKQVMARFSALGLDISSESPNTKKNAKAWEQRKVVHGDAAYRCEWHGKLLWDRDRVHFSLPLAEQDDRVLIGIFVEHLAT